MIVVAGQLNITTTETVTTTTPTTVLRLTDTVAVTDVSVADAFLFLNDAGLTDIAAALEAAKENAEVGSISGRYFLDENLNDVDDGDPFDGVDGKTVSLLDGAGLSVLQTTVTGTQGAYAFTDLAPGDYVVQFEGALDRSLAFVSPNQGADDTIDSDVVNVENGETAVITVGSGEAVTDVDAGVAPVLNLIRVIERDLTRPGEPDANRVRYEIENLSDVDDADVDILTVTELNDDVFGDIISIAEAINGGPIVVEEGETVTITIPEGDLPAPVDVGNARVIAADEEGNVLTGGFNDNLGFDGVRRFGDPLNLAEVTQAFTFEEVTELAPVTRVVGQVLTLPDDCGQIFLTLNADGSTSVEAVFGGGPLTATAEATLGALDLGDLPDGATTPPVPVDLDLGMATDGDMVGSNSLRIPRGENEVLQSSTSISEDENTFFIGDPENDPGNVFVVQGALNIVSTDTTFITQLFDEVTVTDEVVVGDISVEDALALFASDPALADIATALEDAKDDSQTDGLARDTVNEMVIIEDVTDVTETRIVAQVLKLPDDCGEIRLILNADGTTSIEAIIEGAGTFNDQAAALLGALSAGSLPDGATPPDLPGAIDFASVVDDQIVATDTQRNATGETSETTTSVDITEEPGTVFIGDLQNINDIIVISGQVTITTTNTTTITQSFTDLTVNDQIEVQDISVEDALTFLTDAGLTNIATALEDVKDDDQQGEGVLNIETVTQEVFDEDITDATVTRTVAQVLELPDDCGEIFLVLNADGSTSVELALKNQTLSASAAQVLGDLSVGDLPANAVAPDLPASLDLANATDGDVVGTDTQRIETGVSSVVDIDVDVVSGPGTVIVGDPENDPFNVIVFQGQLGITITETTTTTQFFTDLTVTDEVTVAPVSTADALALLNDAGLTDLAAALAAVKEPADEPNIPPDITSADAVSVPENQTSVIDVQATDDQDVEGDGLTFAISGGADADLFTIDAATGVLAFQAAPDFEAPADADRDNDHEVEVAAFDSEGALVAQLLTVTVTDVDEQSSGTGDPVTICFDASMAGHSGPVDVGSGVTLQGFDLNGDPEILGFRLGWAWR